MLESMIPPNVETTLTINADGTYLLIQTFKEKQNEQESLRSTFQVLEGNMLMLALPSSGDIYIFYRDDNSIFCVLYQNQLSRQSEILNPADFLGGL